MPDPTCFCGQCRKCKKREYMRYWRDENRARVRELGRLSRERTIEATLARDRARSALKRQEAKGSTKKQLSRRAVQRALEIGELFRQPCEVCGIEPGRDEKGQIVQAHHDDYDKPLEVRWLCRKHHYELHYGAA